MFGTEEFQKAMFVGLGFHISRMTNGEDIFATNIVMLKSVCSGSGAPQEPLPPLGTQVPNVPQKISPKKEKMTKALNIPGKTVELEMTPLEGLERKWVFKMAQSIRNNETGTVRWVSLVSKRKLYLMKIKDMDGAWMENNEGSLDFIHWRRRIGWWKIF